MNFIEQFYAILANQDVREKIDFLLKEGENDSRFLNYFGVNYDESGLHSIKFYFSFFDFIPNKALNFLQITDDSLSIIKEYWSPVDSYQFFHQGLTLALKCYVKNNQIEIRPYFHFRSEKLPYVAPKHLKLTNKDKLHPFGICVEQHKEIIELKHYYYLEDEISKKSILDQFSIEEHLFDKVDLIEYTESNLERKANFIFLKSEDTSDFIHNSGNFSSIQLLNNHFFENCKLYHFAPGIRYDSTIRAVYYIPKKAHYELCKIDALSELISQLNKGVL